MNILILANGANVFNDSAHEGRSVLAYGANVSNDSSNVSVFLPTVRTVPTFPTIGRVANVFLPRCQRFQR